MKTTLTLALGSALLLPCALSVGTGTIDDMEHIVIFMQENRAFDHYFGTLQGIRGFNDRTTVPLRNGHNAFYQPTNQSDLSEVLCQAALRRVASRRGLVCGVRT